VIDLEQLDARLDLALADELRAHRVTTATPRDPVAPEAPPASPVTVPVATAPRRERSARVGVVSRSPLAPAEVVWDELDIAQHGRAVVDLVSQGKLAEADLHIVAHAELAHDSGHDGHRADAAGWAVMRALLVGREDVARAAIEESKALDDASGLAQSGHPGGQDRSWAQRFAVASTWGDDHERYDVLNHCRQRAYCDGDIAWHGRLTLLLAILGRTDEARREFDSAIGVVQGASATDAEWLDLATDLAEAAAVLGDADRSDLARRGLVRAGPSPVVVVGRAWVCKGSAARYRALAEATAGAIDEADGTFRSAAEAHRRLGAEVLLARTLGEWGHSLIGHDPQRSANLLRESAELSHRLGLAHGGPTIDVVTAEAC